MICPYCGGAVKDGRCGSCFRRINTRGGDPTLAKKRGKKC